MGTVKDKTIMGACGIDCGSCRIMRAGSDPALAEKLADSFGKTKLIPDVTPDIFRCEGCLGDRENHWSGECWILRCCVDEKGYENCSQCHDFPCQRLVDWTAGKPQYKEAMQRLKSMR